MPGQNELWYSRILGRGPDLIVIHGFLGSGDNWMSLGRRWAEAGFRIHLVDLRNHGRSFWSDRFDWEVLLADLDRYILAHGVVNPHILGHSLGGKLAMFDAIRQPANRARYVVLDIAPRAYPPRHGFIFDAVRKINLRNLHGRDEADRAMALHLPDGRIRGFVLKNLKRLPGGGFGWKCNWPVLEQAMERVGTALPPGARSTRPFLFLRGTKSDYISDADKRDILERFPNARIMDVENAGHWLHAEQPEKVYRAVIDFLKE